MYSKILLFLRFIVISISLYYFSIQITIAFHNWMHPPTVDSTSERNLTEHDLPVITACPTNQTNYEKLYSLGYKFRSYAYAGSSNCTNNECYLSWGQHLNLTHQELFKQIHNLQLAMDVKFNQETEERIVLLPRFGFCKEISSINLSKRSLAIFNKHELTNVRVFITDKNYRSYFSLDFSSHVGDKIEVPWGKTFYTDVKLKKTSKCMIKENDPQKFDFKHCVDKKLQNTVGKLIGCVPPWMSTKNQCSPTLNHSMDLKHGMAYFLDYILPLEQMKKTNIETECEYCESAQYFVSVKDELDSDEGWGTNGNKTFRAIIFFDPTVTVTETLFNYDDFKFMIDVGSSFGTWLGFSMISVYDLLAIIVEIIKNNDIHRMLKSVTSK